MTEGVVAIKDNRNDDQNKKKAKPPGVFGFFKAAMFVLRHRTKGKQKAAQVITQQGDWKKLVGSMRPLHLQDNNNNNINNNNTLYCATSPSAVSQYASADDLKSLDQLDTMSQYASANDLKSLDDQASASASSETMSQYASASNLQDLDEQEEDEDDPDKVFDAIGADDMIDAKAELFILQFYQQMRRQNVDSINGQFH
ncbi:uncharacterized protein [Solanum lycopersicum]|uniref:uncharacterized protein n=1 Tax=Solanum lycopersicum TaxID=4081 RepID=UPI0002BCA78C|nr:uncharacterized protein LOC101245470 [Solanum lycopersicum]